eukprot:scaffold288163_cov18-Tisochrysis_lutea.AAC.1
MPVPTPLPPWQSAAGGRAAAPLAAVFAVSNPAVLGVQLGCGSAQPGTHKGLQLPTFAPTCAPPQPTYPMAASVAVPAAAHPAASPAAPHMPLPSSFAPPLAFS